MTVQLKKRSLSKGMFPWDYSNMPKIRRILIDTYPENTVFLHREGHAYAPEQFQALRKVRVGANGCEILASLAIVDGPGLLEPGEVGLGEQAFNRLGLPEGSIVEVAQALPPASLEFVRRKIDGEALGDSELTEIIQDIADHRYSPM